MVSGLRGDVSNLTGDISNLTGDATYVKGCTTNISGDLDRCYTVKDQIIDIETLQKEQSEYLEVINEKRT